MEIDKKKLKKHAVSYGKTGTLLAFKACVLYIALIVFGLIFGGIGGYWGAAYFDFSTWIGVVCALAGIVAGGIGGFFLAQIIIVGLAQDMLLDAGIQAGKTGYRKAKKFMEEKREKEMRDSGINKD